MGKTTVSTPRAVFPLSAGRVETTYRYAAETIDPIEQSRGLGRSHPLYPHPEKPVQLKHLLLIVKGNRPVVVY